MQATLTPFSTSTDPSNESDIPLCNHTQLNIFPDSGATICVWVKAFKADGVKNLITSIKMMPAVCNYQLRYMRWLPIEFIVEADILDSIHVHPFIWRCRYHLTRRRRYLTL